MPSAYINLSLNANKFLQPQWPDSSHRNQISHVPSHQEKERTLQPLRLQGFLDRLTYFEEWGIGGTWLQPGIMPVDYKAAHKRVYARQKNGLTASGDTPFCRRIGKRPNMNHLSSGP